MTQLVCDGGFPATPKECPDAPQNGTKRCSKCRETKPLSEFHKDRSRRDGKAPWCKPCCAANYVAWKKAYPEKAKSAKLLDRFGISVENYNEMLADQNGTCKICRGLNASGRRLAVDHDHKTGEVRGLLCSNCNIAIGLLQDSPELLRAASDYLEASRGTK